MAKYIIGIDQSTQGTKALLFDEEGMLLQRTDLPHKQIVNDKGWVSHDPMEIYRNTIEVVKNLVEETKIDKNEIVGVGISNQRETSLVWDKETGESIDSAIVWQCSRATEICERVERLGKAELIRQKTGMNLSPYFPASKLAWLLENIERTKKGTETDKLCFGTIDSWLIYKLTNGLSYKTDYSNASRTQLFNIIELKWDEEICGIFGINPKNLAEVCDSNANFGETDFEGFLDKCIPIHSVMGDSHGALFGQGCLERGTIKTTYGTGSSIMMNIGENPALSTHGVVTSLAWGMSGKINYVLEGNINYTGAVITWLKDNLELIISPKETEQAALEANQDDQVYLIPAFTGLGAPYWDSKATAAITGITRTTGKVEIIRAGLECIAYQISDVVKAMSEDAGITVKELRVDGGPTKNKYLMQFQSDILNITVQVPDTEELSGIGVAYAAGLALGVYDNTIFNRIKKSEFRSKMDDNCRNKKYQGWLAAVKSVLLKNNINKM
ncbi:glycerol kinase [Clostridium sp. BL-8]|uniref:FGGY-family carbohydrate kinase n=1 Tax=Clostridium sp. BL-8 TaxID=349938 RepID=UPI00098C7821|nr:glycerol kinase [Clostridium sp. BL-8]OOM77359.1 glycerol kinase [Clostridium sp. BL-8]